MSSILDNITNWHVFDDDVNVLNFLTNEGVFKYSSTDEITHDEYLRKFLVIHPHCSIEKAFDTIKYIPTPILRL